MEADQMQPRTGNQGPDERRGSSYSPVGRAVLIYNEELFVARPASCNSAHPSSRRRLLHQQVPPTKAATTSLV